MAPRRCSTVNSVGNLTFANDVPIIVATTTNTGVVQIGTNIDVDASGVISVKDATTLQKGVVQLVNTTSGDCDPLKALTAAAGCSLQTQIDALVARVDALEKIGFVLLDDISASFDGVQVMFQMTIAGVSFTPVPASNLLILMGAVAQVPGVAYTIAGNFITFSEPPAPGTLFSGITVRPT